MALIDTDPDKAPMLSCTACHQLLAMPLRYKDGRLAYGLLAHTTLNENLGQLLTVDEAETFISHNRGDLVRRSFKS
jgi:hypothetical protein